MCVVAPHIKLQNTPFGWEVPEFTYAIATGIVHKWTMDSTIPNDVTKTPDF